MSNYDLSKLPELLARLDKEACFDRPASCLTQAEITLAVLSEQSATTIRALMSERSTLKAAAAATWEKAKAAATGETEDDVLRRLAEILARREGAGNER